MLPPSVGIVCFNTETSSVLTCHNPTTTRWQQYVTAHCPDQLYQVGLVPLDQPLEPYELTLKTMSSRERAGWADRVFSQIRQRHGSDLTGFTFEFHTGVEYRDHLTTLLSRAGASCTCPVEGLAIGERLRFYGGSAPTRPQKAKNPPPAPAAAAAQEQAPVVSLSPERAGFAAVWVRIAAHAGQPFYQIRGGEFRYQVAGQSLRLDRTNQPIPYTHLEEAYGLVPLANTSAVQRLRAPSYIYAILMDPRIRQSAW